MPVIARQLVSIAIPTYNRAEKLERAIRSALDQSYGLLDVAVFDNASTDGTTALCERLGKEDSRLRYIRQPSNLGPTANFVAARDQSRAEFFMWLGDDDWIDRDYVEKCLEALRDPMCAVAGGMSIYLYPNGLQKAGKLIDICRPTAAERVLEYYEQVTDNALFYGLYRREALERIALKSVLAGDWLVLAEVLLYGTARTVVTTRMWREIGASATFEDTLRVMGAPTWYRYLPYGIIASTVFAEIAWQAPKYAETIPASRRLALAWNAARRIIARHGLGGPTVKAWTRAQAKRLLLQVLARKS